MTPGDWLQVRFEGFLPNALLLEEFNHTLSLEKYGPSREIVTYIDSLISDNPIFHIIESFRKVLM
jgi:hypothetical protein